MMMFLSAGKVLVVGRSYVLSPHGTTRAKSSTIAYWLPCLRSESMRHTGRSLPFSRSSGGGVKIDPLRLL